MGQLILPSGGAINVDEFHGTAELSNLVRELNINDLTDQYRIAVIGCLARIGRQAQSAVSDLRRLAETGTRIIKEAASQALGKIEADKSPVVVSPPAPVVNRHQTHHATHHTTHRSVGKEKTRVELIPIKKTGKLLDSCPALNECNFCQKIYEPSVTMDSLNNILAPGGRFCRFCMRNKFYSPEVTKNVAILSYRCLIGYIHYAFAQNNNIIYGAELKEMIQDHVSASSSNPLFSYDPDTYNWYINMEPVASNKIKYKEIGLTIASQLCALGIAEVFYRGSPHLIYQRIMYGLSTGEKLIIPMPKDGGCGVEDKGIPKDYLTEFIYSHMVDTGKNARKWDKAKKDWSNYGGF